MPDGLLTVLAFLCFGYLLILVEIFIPGGIVGILGLLLVAYGCYLAFGLGLYWGLGAIGLSIVLTAVLVYLIVRSRAARSMMLEDRGEGGWKAPSQELAALVGEIGTALTTLRPSGQMAIGELRVDVVTDGEYIDAEAPLKVIGVEGSRVVVERIEDGAEPPA